MGADASIVGESGGIHEAYGVKKILGGHKGHRVVGELKLPGGPKSPRVEGTPWGGKPYGLTPNGNRVLGGDRQGQVGY